MKKATMTVELIAKDMPEIKKLISNQQDRIKTLESALEELINCDTWDTNEYNAVVAWTQEIATKALNDQP